MRPNNYLLSSSLRRLLTTRRSRVAITSVFFTAILIHLSLSRFNAWHEKFKTIPKEHRYNLLMEWTPRWAKSWLDWYEPDIYREVDSPPYVPELLDATWMGNFPVPELQPPKCGTKKGEVSKDTPLLLTIYIFSTVNPEHNPKRSTVRQFHPLLSVPPEYRHLIDVKFVVGRSADPEVEAALDKEEAEFGDLVRLDGLKNLENRDNGKATRWLIWAGKYGRPSQWILKCDDDSMPVMPNFMPWIAAQDPTKPAYFGSGMRRNIYFRHYFVGLIYGFSWPLVQTISTSNMTDADIDRDTYEDFAIGELMWMLPSRPGQPKLPDPNMQYNNMPPPNPDPRTGLVRLEVLDKMADEFAWWAVPWNKMFAYHGMKDHESYQRRYQFILDKFAEKGWKYEWKVPHKYRKFKNNC